MVRGVSGPSQNTPAARTSPPSKTDETVDLRNERTGAERPPKAAGSAAKAVRHQQVNQGLQTKRILRQQIAQRQAGPVGEAAVAPPGDGLVVHNNDLFNDPLGNEAPEAPEGGQQQDPPEAANEAAGGNPQQVAIHIGGGEAAQGVGRQAAMDRLEGSNLANDAQQAGRTVDAEQKAMYRAASWTATKQGTGAYTGSFGAWGVASRALGVMTAALTKNPVVNGAVNTVLPLTMPLTHGAAGAASQPGDEGTKFIPTPGRQLPDNAKGNAFRPFIGGLGVGNPAVSAVVDGSTAARNAAVVARGGNPIDPKANVSIQGVVKNALFFIPGMASGIHTARNVFATQARARMSLQEPAKNAAGEQVGVVVTHQAAIPQGDGRQEIGQVKVNHGDRRIGIAIDRLDDGTTSVRRSEPTPIEGTPSLPARAQTYFQGLSLRISSVTLTKTAALGSTLAANAAVSTHLGPVVKSALEARGVDPAVAGSVSAMATTAASSALLSLDFIPKFMTFDQPTPPADAPPAAQRTWREFFDNTAAGKVLQASIPGIGGGIAWATGRADLGAAPRLDQTQFAGLAENKADMLAGLTELDAGIVTRANDGTLRIDAEAARAFIQQQPAPNPPAAAPQQNPA